MLIISIQERDLADYLEQYFDDYDNDNYARLIKNYPTLKEDFLHHALC